MEAKELRIGNIVKYKKGHLAKVSYLCSGGDKSIIGIDGIESNYVDGAYKDVDILPIQLTEEILLKCGFSYNGTTWQGEFDDTYSEWVFDERDEFCDYDETIKWNNDRGIKYLHQLQNMIFALTGNELEVNL